MSHCLLTRQTKNGDVPVKTDMGEWKLEWHGVDIEKPFYDKEEKMELEVNIVLANCQIQCLAWLLNTILASPW